MARLQVLPLPAEPDGLERYAFVIDRAGDLTESDQDALRAFATSAGGQGVVILAGELVMDQGDNEVTGALAELLQEAISVPDVAQPTPPQAPKLPPPNTLEGKYARILGGQKFLDEMRDGDPRP